MGEIPSNVLMLVSQRCWAEVDLDALRQNLAWIRHHAGQDTLVMTVVKADAYGHGLKQIAALLMQSGTDIFGVANLTEARAIRSVGKGWPILMLGACLPHEIDIAIRENVMATISSLEEARAFSLAAAKRKRTARLHVKVDAGMSRLGARPESIPELVDQIQRLPSLKLCGLYAHYSSVDSDARLTRAPATPACGSFK